MSTENELRADLTSAARVIVELRAEIETLRDQGAEAFDAMTTAYDSQTEELRAVTQERDDAIAAVRALLPHAEARALWLSERISLDVGAVECWEVIRAAKELLTKVSP